MTHYSSCCIDGCRCHVLILSLASMNNKSKITVHKFGFEFKITREPSGLALFFLAVGGFGPYVMYTNKNNKF